MTSELIERYKLIQSRIEAAALSSGRDPTDITLLAVSKTFSADHILKLAELGHRDFAENYVQELLEKQTTIGATPFGGSLRWHFIGHLQSNKAKMVAGKIQMLHSLSSIKLAHEVQKKQAQLKDAPALPVFLEFNIDEEPSKSGFLKNDLAQSAEQIRQECPQIQVVGLMVIPSPETSGDPQRAKQIYTETRKFGEGLGLRLFSMGMSSDFEVAIACGATHVRVGTALFGDRTRKA